MQRMKIEEIRKDPWFRRNYVPVKLSEDVEVNLDDVQAVFDDIEVCCCFSYCCLICRKGSYFANVYISPFLLIYR